MSDNFASHNFASGNFPPERLPARGNVWDLSLPDDQCHSQAPGHWINWMHFNISMRRRSPVIPVTVSVGDDGLVHLEGDDLSLMRCNHRPALLRDALDTFAGMAEWKPSFRLLLVPAESFWGSAQCVFHLAAPSERSECYVGHRPKSEQLGSTDRQTDRSHIPPLRVADRYARGRRRRK